MRGRGMLKLWLCLPLLLGFQTQPPVEPVPADIVITGQKLLRVGVRYALRGPFMASCTTSAFATDPAIDKAVCYLVMLCVRRGETLPDTVDRCLKSSIAEVVDGRVTLRIDGKSGEPRLTRGHKTPVEAPPASPPPPPAETLADAPGLAAPDIVVTAPTLPATGRWRFSALSTAIGRAAVSPQSWEQCIAPSASISLIEQLVQGGVDGEGQRGCHVVDMKVGNGSITATRRCLIREGRIISRIEGRYDGDRIRFNEDITEVMLRRQMDGSSERQSMRMVTGDRIGDCHQ